MERLLQPVQERLRRTGTALTAGLTLPLVAFAAITGKIAVDFETAFAGVQKTVSATEEEFAALRAGIIDLSSRVPASTTQISAVAEAAGQLGIATPNLLKFTEVMIGLGEATNLSANEAATALARFANIMGTSQDEFDRLGSSIVALGNNFATTEREIVEMALRLSGAGKVAGLSEAQLLGLAAALSSVGIRAEAGGTAFSRVLFEMREAVDAGGESLTTFAAIAGLTGQAFADLFKKDAGEAVTKFVEGLGNIENSGGSATLALERLGFSQLRVRDALIRTATAGDLVRTALDLGTKAFEENTALTEEVTRRYETLASQLTIVKNKISAALLPVGEVLAGTLRRMIPLIDRVTAVFQKLADGFKNLPPAAQTLIVTLGVLAAAIGPVLLALAGLVAFATPLLAAFAVLISPIGLVVAALAGLVTFLVLSGEASGELGKITQSLKGLFIQVYQALVSIVRPSLERMKRFWEEHGEKVLIAVSGLISGIAQTFQKVVSVIAPIVRAGLAIIAADWETAMDSLEELTETAVDRIGKKFAELKGVFANVRAALSGDLEAAEEAAIGILDQGGVVGGILSRFLRQRFRTTLSGGIVGLSGQIEELAEEADDAAESTSILDAFVSSLGQSADGTGEKLGTVADVIRDINRELRAIGEEADLGLINAAQQAIAEFETLEGAIRAVLRVENRVGLEAALARLQQQLQETIQGAADLKLVLGEEVEFKAIEKAKNTLDQIQTAIREIEIREGLITPFSAAARAVTELGSALQAALIPGSETADQAERLRAEYEEALILLRFLNKEADELPTPFEKAARAAALLRRGMAQAFRAIQVQAFKRALDDVLRAAERGVIGVVNALGAAFGLAGPKDFEIRLFESDISAERERLNQLFVEGQLGAQQLSDELEALDQRLKDFRATLPTVTNAFRNFIRGAIRALKDLVVELIVATLRLIIFRAIANIIAPGTGGLIGALGDAARGLSNISTEATNATEGMRKLGDTLRGPFELGFVAEGLTAIEERISKLADPLALPIGQLQAVASIKQGFSAEIKGSFETRLSGVDLYGSFVRTITERDRTGEGNAQLLRALGIEG